MYLPAAELLCCTRLAARASASSTLRGRRRGWATVAAGALAAGAASVSEGVSCGEHIALCWTRVGCGRAESGAHSRPTHLTCERPCRSVTVAEVVAEPVQARGGAYAKPPQRSMHSGRQLAVVRQGAVLDVWEDDKLSSLATQVWWGRAVELRAAAPGGAGARRVHVQDDGYIGFVSEGAAQAALVPMEAPPEPTVATGVTAKMRRGAVEEALRCLDAGAGAYVWGGAVPLSERRRVADGNLAAVAQPSGGHGWDCSGLVQWAFAKQGLILGRDAWMQEACCAPLASLNAATPGDLLFFGGSGNFAERARGARATHVALVVPPPAVNNYVNACDDKRGGENLLWFLHASGYDIGHGATKLDAVDRGTGVWAGQVAAAYGASFRFAATVVRGARPSDDWFAPAV